MVGMLIKINFTFKKFNFNNYRIYSSRVQQLYQSIEHYPIYKQKALRRDCIYNDNTDPEILVLGVYLHIL